MTPHPAPHVRTHHTSHDHADHAAWLPALLDLDAQVLGGYLPDVIAWAGEHVQDVRRVLDLGAGTGVGALALAARFPEAQVVAVERSRTMVERLTALATGSAPAAAVRLRVLEADLDGDWPDLAPADLVWACSSLHEVADPARVLRAAHDALRPGGVAVVVEMDALPGLLPEDVGSGEPGLEGRCHAALTAAGWNAHPDWTADLETVGLEVVGRRRFAVEVGPGHPRTEEYARAWLRHQRLALGDALPPDDLDTLDRLLADHGPDAVLSGARLRVRGSRTAWLARRPLTRHP